MSKQPSIQAQATESSDFVEKPKKRRGRKLTEPSKYHEDSETKINEWRRILDNGKWDNGRTLSKKDKEGLRNRISAQISRMNKKLELFTLQQKQNHYKSQFNFLLDTLNELVSE